MSFGRAGIESFPKPVIAGITPGSLRSYTQWIKNCGLDWFFVPGSPDELLTRVTVALHRHAGQKRSIVGRAFSILLADDDVELQDLFRAMLQGHGILLRCVGDGKRALELARDWVPDLIVLDVMMPIMDGFAALAALKMDDLTKEIPVIMLTGNHQDSEILRGLTLGASDYVKKPFDAPSVLERVLGFRSQRARKNHD